MRKSEVPHKYILVGASGTGKSTMAGVLTERLGLKRCITTTTRPPRSGEINGKDYHFVASMEGLDLFESAPFGGHEYGITRDSLMDGDFVILEPQGVEYYKNNYPGPLTVILLQRNGIEVDAERRARDRDAGFDKVQADLVVHGDTVEEMSDNLVRGMRSLAAEQLREGVSSQLAEKSALSFVSGTARLFFNESRFGLPVEHQQMHQSYREPPYSYDGLYCFDSANYDFLVHAFKSLADYGETCRLDFDMRGENDEAIFFAWLHCQNGRISMDLFSDAMDINFVPLSFDNIEDAINIAYGGFLATEIDAMGEDMLDLGDSVAVQAYRKFLSEGRYEIIFDVNASLGMSLDDRIHDAQLVSENVQSKVAPLLHER